MAAAAALQVLLAVVGALLVEAPFELIIAAAAMMESFIVLIKYAAGRKTQTNHRLNQWYWNRSP